MSNEDLKPTSPNEATETPAGGMGQPIGAKSKAGAGKPASAADLSATIELLLEQNKKLLADNQELKARIAATPTGTEGAINNLANLLAEAIKPNAKPAGPSEEDNVNRSSAYNTKNQIDGQSLMEAQATLMQFRDERKVPISVPKLLAAYIGPQLAVSVNGVRVSIPADGKTYYINETHALAAKERMAKVNRLQSKEPSNIVTIE